MADTSIAISAGTGTNIDTRTEATNGNHRQVVVLGDPATNAGVAPVDATAGLKVDLGTDNDITGTVTANLSATDNAVLDAIAASVDTIDSVDFATQTTLAAIKAKTDNIPAQGQALAAASVPVVLTAAQITTLTPPAAITGFATSAKQDTIIGHVDGVETLLGTIDADTSVLSVVGTGTEATAQRVTIASDSTGVLSVDDNGGSLTVDGTVTADLGATDNAVLDAIAASTAAIETAVEGTLTVTGGGGGTEYTEDAAAAANPVGNALLMVREDARAGSLTTTDGDNVALRGNNKGEAYVKTTDSDALLTTIDADTGNISTKIDTLAGAVAGSEVQVDVLTMPTVTVNAHAVTNAGTFVTQENGALLTAAQLIDDTVATLGTTTYTEAATKGNIIGAVRRDADTTLVDTTNEVSPLQVDANGRLKVEAFSGETLPVSLTSTTVTGTVAVTQSGTWDEVGINDSGNSITVDYATTGSGTATGALRVELPTNGTGVIATVGAVTSLTNALPAGTNAIGKLAANSGVDIGDVDVTSISAGTNAIGNVGLIGRTTGGLTIFRSLDIDESEEEVKATAGQVFTITAFNTTAAPLYLKFYNATAANVTVGSTTPVLTFLVPGNADSDGAGFVHSTDIGYAFGTAITVACTTGIADADTTAPGANACLVNIGYM